MQNLGMQLSTYAITVPTGSCRLVLFLTVLSLPRSTKHDAIRTSVTQKSFCVALPAIFKASIVKSRAPCTVACASNSRLTALFPEVTHAEFVRRELECIIGCDGEEI